MSNWIEIKSGRNGRNGRKIKARKREIPEINLLLIPKDVFKFHILSKLDLSDLKNLLLINPEYNTAITAYLETNYYFKVSDNTIKNKAKNKAKNIFIEEINDSNCKKILNSLNETNVESIIIDENHSGDTDLSKFKNLKCLSICCPFDGSKELPCKIEKLKIWGNVNPVNLTNLKYFRCRFTANIADGFNFNFTQCPNIRKIYIYHEDYENSFYEKVRIEVKNCKKLERLYFAGSCPHDIDFEGCYELWDISLGEYFEGNLLNISDCKKLKKLKIGDIVKDTGPFGRFASVDHYFYFSSFNKPLNLEENVNLQELTFSTKHTESVRLPKNMQLATNGEMYERTYRRV